ncbi:Unknown protein [Striga hermonthica]|uniref:Uncharacterized protein n=1 Tax=Striga hermonthica TaxID=68872 RepID=A0A9N7MPQ1_STRHE|nr:Unknown protein [Striga hermonthica]
MFDEKKTVARCCCCSETDLSRNGCSKLMARPVEKREKAAALPAKGKWLLEVARLNDDERREMTGKVERRSLEEKLELEGAKGELPECGNGSKITYTRALLLEFIEAEACRELPGDFDLLILSELNGGAGSTLESKWITGNSSLLGTSPYTGLQHRARWNNYLVMPIKESHCQGNWRSEESTVVWQHLPQECRYNTEVFDQKTPDSGSFQLKKSKNPYRPPHCSKKIPRPLDSSSQVGVESSASSSFSAEGSDWQSSTDSATGIQVVSPHERLDDSIKQLHECESSSSRNKEASEPYSAYDKLELQIIDDSQPTFEDFWADILESLQLQQEAGLRPTPTPDSDNVVCLPDEDSLISRDDSVTPKALNFNMSENEYDASSSEDDIIWPDENSLISVEDMLGLNMPLDRDIVETSKMTSNVEAEIGNSSGCLNEKTHFQPCSHPGNNYVNFPTKSNYMPYIPATNHFTCFNFLHQSCFNNARPNDSFVQYSMFQQPNICPRQQTQLPVDLQMNPQQTTYLGYGKPNAGGFVGKQASSFWHAQH